MKNLSLLLLVCFLASCSSSNKLLLRVNSPEGNSLKYRHTSEQVINTMAMGMSQEQEITQVLEYDYKIIKELEDGKKDLKITIKDVSFNQTGMQAVSYDSKSGKEASGPSEKIYEAMLGSEFLMKMDVKGAITEFSGGDAMIDKMMKSLGNSMDPAMLEQISSTTKAQFGDEAMRQSMASFSDIYPDKEVKPGDSWEKSFEMASMGLLSANNYTLTKVEGGVAFIAVKGTINSREDSKPLDMGTMTVKYDLSGTQAGEIKVDVATGWVINSNVAQKVGGNMNIKMEAMPSGFDAEMDMDSNILFEQINE